MIDGERTARTAPKADTILCNGRVLQFDLPEGRADWMVGIEARFATALAIRDGKFVYVGDDEGVMAHAGPATHVIDVESKLVLPGLIDSHVHGVMPTVRHLDYMPATDLDAVLEEIKAILLREDQAPYLHDPNSLLRIIGFSSTTDPDQAKMNRYVLDRLSKDPGEDPVGTGTSRPISLFFSGWHSEWVNSRALEIAGIDQFTQNPPGGDIDRAPGGLPTGKLTDVAGFNLGIEPPLPADAIRNAKLASVREMSRQGITGAFFAGGEAEDLEAWMQLADEGQLTMFINLALWANHIRGLDEAAATSVVDGFNTLRAKYHGYKNAGAPGELALDTAKIMCDGVSEFPGQTAAMYDPYKINVGTAEQPIYIDGEARGEDPSCSDSIVAFQLLHENRWSIMTHSLGDRAVGEALDNFEEVLRDDPWDARHVVTHGQFVRPSDVPRFADLGVIYNPQAQWAASTAFTETLIRPFVEKSTYETQFPLNTVIAHGGVVAGGSDWPVDPLNPWLVIQTAVTRQSALKRDRDAYGGPIGNPDDRLTRLQAVCMHTLASARQVHRDDRTGSIEVGKDADLVIVDQDILSEDVDVHDIHRTKAVLTMFQGNTVWDAVSGA